MTWTSPATPVTETTITVSFWNTNARDNLNHLRGLLPDAGAANQFLVSSSTTAAAFTASLPDVILASGKKVTFANEDAIKIDLRAGNFVIGVDANWELYQRSVRYFTWRTSAAALRMQLDCDTANGTLMVGPTGNGAIEAATGTFSGAVTSGGDTLGKIASGSYEGNGVQTGRQITTGFQAKYVVIEYGTYGGIHTVSTARAWQTYLNHPNAEVGVISGVHLHASDGFVVGDGATSGNDSGVTYTWVAFG